MRALAAALLGLAAAAPQTLFQFPGGAGGSGPTGQLALGPGGTLFGVTNWGGRAGLGIAFSLAPPASAGGAWTETVLHGFTPNAFAPNTLLRVPGGALIGTTYDGGHCAYDCGTAFRLVPGRPALYRHLANFEGAADGNGGGPFGVLLPDGHGGFLGTSVLGGHGVCTNLPGPCGTVFHLTKSDATGGRWHLTAIVSFRGPPDGEAPYGGLVADAAGRLYGAASQGGTGHCTDGEGGVLGCGTIFRVQPAGDGTWSETTLYDFRPNEQNNPGGPLLFGADGALYGTATYDVFRLAPPRQGDRWTKERLFTFEEGIAGTIPNSPLVADRAGNLYGTTRSSGLSGFSTVYRLSPPRTAGGAWRRETLATFDRGFGGLQPAGGLVLGHDGRLYGTTAKASGAPGGGTVFALQP